MSSSLALLLLKVSVIMCAALLAARLMRRSSASRRHSLWSGAFAAMMLLPALALVLPPIDIEMPARQSAVTTQTTVMPADPATSAADSPPPQGLSDARPSEQLRPSSAWTLPSFAQVVIGVWIIGFSAAILALLVSLARVVRLWHRARPIAVLEWHAAAASTAKRLGLSAPVRLAASGDVSTPMAAGVLVPTVFLPADAASWDAERRDVVLAHEIAHLASRDPLRHLVGRLALAVYWFHPLAWLAARDASTACEEACDEAVLSLGFRPSTYAQILLDFAGGAPPAPALALPFARRALLETRLMSILDSSPRQATGRLVLPAVLGAALTLCVAAIRPTTATPVSPVIPTIPPAVVEAPVITRGPAVENPIAPSVKARSPIALEEPERFDCARTAWNGEFSQFSGSTTNSRGNGIVDRIVQKSFADLRVCAAAVGVTRSDDGKPSEWIGRSDRVVIETEERAGDRRRMEFVGGVMTYSINGRATAVDADAEGWRRATLALLDAMWEVSELRGRVSTMRGEISTIYGERSTLQGEISTLRGQVSTMQGEISTLRGEESTMRGEISTIRGHYSTLQGQISTERGAISSLMASRNDRYADRGAIDAAIRRHEDEIRRIEAEIDRYDVDRRVREVEQRIASFDVEARVREVQRRIRDFDVEARVAEVQRRLARLDVEGQVRSIEREIAGMDVESRVAALEARQDAALQDLRARLRR